MFISKGFDFYSRLVLVSCKRKYIDSLEKCYMFIWELGGGDC